MCVCSCFRRLLRDDKRRTLVSAGTISSICRFSIFRRPISRLILSCSLLNRIQTNIRLCFVIKAQSPFFHGNLLLAPTIMVFCPSSAATGKDKVNPQQQQQEQKHNAIDGNNRITGEISIPEDVRQFERQVKKARAEARVACPISIENLRVIFVDPFIVVVDKPSGTLSVPGLRGNPSIAQLVFDAYGCESGRVDKMIVHRLDMDTSGIVLYARTDAALKALNRNFREHQMQKTYEALVCGSVVDNEGEINLPIQRDHEFPPFMRVSTKESELKAALLVENLQHLGYKKLLRKYPKQCLTRYSVMGRELLNGKEPVTRLSLTPVTGRTHQLRVHLAAIGHPIVADQTYGYLGEGCENGGFDECTMQKNYPYRASTESQQRIDSIIREDGKNLCLHAKQLCLPHPITGAMMTFDSQAPF